MCYNDMLKQILLGICIICSSHLKADYIDYYNQVNEGEYQLYLGHYGLAIANFEQAFSHVDQPKPRDLFLKAKCHSQLLHEDEMYELLETALSSGLDSMYLIGDSLWFDEYRFTKRFKHLIQNFYKPKFYPAITLNYRQTLDTLILDLNSVHFRELIKQALFIRDSSVTIQDSIKTLYEEYILNKGNQLIKTVLANPIPTNPKDLKDIIELSYSFLRPKCNRYNVLMSFFLKALEDGQLTPIQYAEISEFTQNYFDFSSENARYGLINNSIELSHLDTILKNRRSIGMSTYYALSPDYKHHYRPDPISDYFVAPRTSESSN